MLLRFLLYSYFCNSESRPSLLVHFLLLILLDTLLSAFIDKIQHYQGGKKQLFYLYFFSCTFNKSFILVLTLFLYFYFVEFYQYSRYILFSCFHLNFSQSILSYYSSCIPTTHYFFIMFIPNPTRLHFRYTQTFSFRLLQFLFNLR